MSKKQEVDMEVEEMENPPVLYIELEDRRPSGFIMDLDGRPAGSFGTEHFIELDAPLARFIPTSGFRRGTKKEIKNGKTVDLAYNEPIRYIKEQTEISVEKQKLLGIEPGRATKENLIEVKRGNFSVVREGSYIGLYDYLLDVFYNSSNPNRSERATKIYKVVELGKEEEDLNDYDIMMADALMLVKRFYQKTAKGYVYKEDKINTLCSLFEIYAETMSGKVTALNALAKADPKKFIHKAEKFLQMNMTFVAHALHLNVIRFNDNTVESVDREKIFANLGSQRLTNQEKIERFSELLETDDFKEAKEELMIELEIAQENALNK